ncbi:MAG: hypothetical protein Tsb002_26000 [Wenzhouxiangellaceae bacterium]
MNRHSDDREWINRLRDELDHDDAALDPQLAQQLQRARRQALTQAPPRHWRLPLWLGAAATAVLVSAIVFRPQPVTGPPLPATAAESAPLFADLELLAADDFALFEEDPEFYAWLESELSDAG